MAIKAVTVVDEKKHADRPSESNKQEVDLSSSNSPLNARKQSRIKHSVE